MAERKLPIRLSLEDGEKVRAALKQLGADGEAALKRLEFAGGEHKGLKALGTVAEEVRGRLAGLAQSAGPVGGFLTSLGPWGLAAAAGLGAVGTALTLIDAKSREIRESGTRIDGMLKATGNAAGITRKEIENLADEIEATTLFDDAQIKEAATQLLAFKSLTADLLGTVVRAGADYAAVFRTDVVGSTVKVGEAMEALASGNAGKLRSAFDFLGASTLDLVEELAKAGRVTEAQSAFFAGLQARIGGASQGTGVVGAARQLALAWDDLLTVMSRAPAQGSLGDWFLRQLAGGVQAAANALSPTPLLQQIDAVREKIKEAEAELADLQSRPPTAPLGFGPRQTGADRRAADIEAAAAAVRKLRDQEAGLVVQLRAEYQANEAIQAQGMEQRARDERAAIERRTKAAQDYIREQGRAIDLAGKETREREKLTAAAKAEAEIRERMKGASEEEMAFYIQAARRRAETEVETRQATQAREEAQRRAAEEAKRAGDAAVKALDDARKAELAAADASTARLAKLTETVEAEEQRNRLLALEAQGMGLTAREAAALTAEYEVQRLEQERDEKIRGLRLDRMKAEADAQKALTQGERDLHAARAATIDQEIDATRGLYDRRQNAARTRPFLELEKREAEKLFADITRQAERMSGDVADFLVDAFVNAERAGHSVFDHIWDGAIAGAKRFAYRLAATLLEQNIILPVTTEIVGAVPELFGIARGGRTRGGGAAIPGAGLFDGGALIPSFDAWMQGKTGWGGGWGAGLGPNELSQMASLGITGPGLLQGGNGFAAFSSASNVLGVLGAALPGIMAGNGGQAVLGTGGAALGMFLGGPVGGAIGGTVGNLVGSLLFRKKPSVGPGQAADFLAYGDGRIEARSFAQDNKGSLATAEQYGREVVAGLDQLLEAIGGVRLAAGTTFSVGSNQKDKFGYSLFRSGGEMLTDTKGLETLGDTVVALFLEAVEQGLVEGLGENIRTAFDQAKPATADALQEIVARVQSYEALIKPALGQFDPAASSLGVALKASADQFEAARKSAEELGLALGPLDERAAEAAAALRDGFVRSLESEARDAQGRGFLNSLLEIGAGAQSRAASNVAGFGNDPAALMSNQGLINEIFGGQVEQALSGLDVAQLGAVVAFFGAQTGTTAEYITALAQHLIALGDAAETASTGITDAGRAILSGLDVRELRLGGDERGAIVAQGAIDKAAALARATAEGLNAEELARLAAVIDGELNAALTEFDRAATYAAAAAAEAAAETARQAAEQAEANARASRDFDADLAIREARLGGNDRGALVLQLAAERTAAIEAAEAAGRTAEQIARLATLLDREAAAALAEFDAGIGSVAGSLDDAAARLRAFNEDLQVRGAVLSGDELAASLLRFDLDAARQREAAAEIAGADLAELERVLAGERLTIVEDYNERLAAEQERAAEAAARAAEQAAEAQRRAMEEAARAAEEAARRLEEVRREGAAIMDDIAVRDLRSRGLDREADILAKQRSNARELARIDQLIREGAGTIDRAAAVAVLDRELRNLIEGTAGTTGRGEGYDPNAYSQFFRIAASKSLINANENLRDYDLMSERPAFQLGSSNEVFAALPPQVAGPAPDPLALIEAARSALPVSSMTIGDLEAMNQKIVDPLSAIREQAMLIRANTAPIVDIAAKLDQQRESGSERLLRVIAQAIERHIQETRAQTRAIERPRERGRGDQGPGASSLPPVGFYKRVA